MKTFCRLLLSVSPLFLLACQSKNEQKSDTYLFRVPWVVGRSVEMRTIPVSTLTDLDTLQGSVATLYYKPIVTNNSVVGGPPHIKYFKGGDGGIQGTNVESVLMLSLYAFAESLNNQLVAWNVGFLQKGPLKIAYNTVDFPTLSAAYSFTHKAVFFSDAQINSGVPLAVNPGVFGHEFFHGLFAHTAQAASPTASLHFDSFMYLKPTATAEKDTKGLSQEDKQHLLSTSMRACNEGLADIWGWLFSEDPSFVVNSIPGVDRDLRSPTQAAQLKAVNFRTKAFETRVRKESGFFYVAGASVSRVLYQAAVRRMQQSGMSFPELKSELGFKILKASANYLQSYEKQDVDLITPKYFLDIFFLQNPEYKFSGIGLEEL